MNCPVCKRSLAPTLSICPSCGAMMNDTVREEMQSKIATGSSAFAPLQKERTIAPMPAFQQSSVRPPLAPQKRIQTSGLSAMKTSPTLVEFQHKNKAIPDWRLQLQNAVQQRKGGQRSSGERQPLAATDFTREGRKPEAPAIAESPEIIADPRVANAMRRIAESRKTFLEPDASPKTNIGIKAEQSRPFGVVPVTGTAVAVERATLPATSKPTLVNAVAPAVLKRDTNKLPRIEISGTAAESEDARPESRGRSEGSVGEEPEIKRIRITVEKNDIEEPEWPVEEIEDIEDLALFSMRFGAGLFDFIIGVFVSMLLLSPLVFVGMEWMSWAGLLTLIGTTAVALFLYMTACLGFFGKTPGMKLFSLELVDAVDNEYPTLRQSAVNSSIFLLSLTFVGAGFVTLLFNEEKRAIHDLLSGTILVREF